MDACYVRWLRRAGRRSSITTKAVPLAAMSSTATRKISGWSLAGIHGTSALYFLDDVAVEEVGPGIEEEGPGTAAAPAPVPLGRGRLVVAGVRVVLDGLTGLGLAAAGSVDVAVVDAGVDELGVVLGSGIGSADGVGVELVSTTVGSGAGGALGSSCAHAVPARSVSSSAAAAAMLARARFTGRSRTRVARRRRCG
jgi:hypothetical protein